MEKLPTVSITLLNPLFTLFENNNINLGHFLINEGIDSSIHKNPDSKISIQEMYHLIKTGAEVLADPFVGLHMGEQFTGPANIVGGVMANCRNLGEAYRACIQYQTLFDKSKKSELLIKDNRVTLTFSLVIDYYDRNRILSEFRGAAAYLSLEKMSGKNIALREIHFRHERPENISEYERIFKCPIHFSSEINAMMFDDYYLELPLKQPNPNLRSLLDSHAQQMLKRMQGNELYSDRVKKIIQNSMPDYLPGIKQVARQMAISVRKLQMKLKDEGSSFSRIVDKTREELALQYLQDKNININEVTFLLSFSEPSSFQRSFKRWKGMTPGKYRKDLEKVGNV